MHHLTLKLLEILRLFRVERETVVLLVLVRESKLLDMLSYTTPYEYSPSTGSSTGAIGDVSHDMNRPAGPFEPFAWSEPPTPK